MKFIARIFMPLLVIELIRQAGYEYSSWKYWALVLTFIVVNIAYDWAVIDDAKNKKI